MLDYNLLGKNSLIGSFEIDISHVYFSKDHAILHKWVAISNIEKEFTKISGFVKLSVQVYTQGDKQILLTEEEVKGQSSVTNMGLSNSQDPQFQQDSQHFLMSSMVKTHSYQLVISIFKAENLIKADTFGSIDPFILIQFGKMKFKTKIIKNNPNPEWLYFIINFY